MKHEMKQNKAKIMGSYQAVTTLFIQDKFTILSCRTGNGDMRGLFLLSIQTYVLHHMCTSQLYLNAKP